MSGKNKPLILLAAAALNAALLSGCAEGTPVEEAREEGPTAEAAILGETVTIESEVAKVVGPNVFIVGEDTLVLAADMTGQLEEGDNVQITGTVRTFIQTDVEPEYGMELNNEEESVTVDYEEQLAVVAQKVQELP
jgi:hypothetical protein